MAMDIPSAAGVLAGIIGFVAFIPYIKSTLERTTVPNRATWVIWAVLGIIIAASYYSAGARDTAWTPTAYAIGILIVAALSFRYGEGGFGLFDVACLIGAGTGLALWLLTKDPALALYLTIIVDAIGSLPTIKKAYERPGTEDRTAWALFFAANIINLFAIREWTLAIASYPVYVLILNVVMNAFLWRHTTKNAGR